MMNRDSNAKTHAVDASGLEYLSTYEEIYAQIAMYEAAIIRLKRRRNELSSICRLPPEVLCKILLAWTESLALDPRMYSYHSKMAEWTGGLRACKHWREVALSCPELWSNIAFSESSHQWASTLLERSKQTPTSVTITGFSPTIEPVIIDALSQVSRLKSVTVSVQKAFALQLNNMTGEAPCLESIRLSTPSKGKFSTLPATFLAGGSPRLRRVDMSGWLPQAIWSTPFLQGLTSLKWSICIGYIYDEDMPVAATSSAEFARALRNMPMLEELDLGNTIPTFKGLEGGPAPLIHLKTLRLTGSARTCAGALSCMLLPSSATVEIQCSFKRDTSLKNDSLALASALHASWMSNPLSTSTPSPPFTSLRIFDERASPQLVLFVQRDVDPDISTPALTILPRCSSSVAALSHIAPALPLNNLRSMYLSLRYENDVSAALFSRLPALESVELEGYTAIRFIAVLKADPAFRPIKKLKGNSASKSHVAVSYFPALKSLKLSQVEFYNKHELEDLIDVLMWRCEHGGEIESLTLENCSKLRAKGVARLREIVVNDSQLWSAGGLARETSS